MNELLFQFNIKTISCLLLLASGIVAYLYFSRRSAEDVLDDLSEFVPDLFSEEKQKTFISSKQENERKYREEYSFLGTLTHSEIANLKKTQIYHILSGLCLGLIIAFIFFKTKFLLAGVSVVTGLCIGYLSSQRKYRVLEEQFKKEIIFYLPVVMERVVMAVQAGLDILPALKAIEEIEAVGIKTQSKKFLLKPDAVTRLLGQVIKLCESGLSFDQSLREVAASIKSNALRHCFIHLAVAQKEGGELIYPLRELSDATQLYFQESIEEDIAKMPIKATMPLLLTFAGLIISFMTGPVIQILNVSINPKMLNEKARQHQEAREVSSAR